ncbi:NADPH-dependent 1-acyl dihydroxyacetone phosphate reductase [Lecanora helva]
MGDSRKTVLITGCSPGGIGNFLAREFHAKGLRVVATARKTETIQDLRDLGIETLSLEVDQEQSVHDCKEQVTKMTGGGLDYLVNNAGRNYAIPAIEASFTEMTSVFDTNFFAIVRLCQTFMPLLRHSQGTIVQIGSVAACIPYAWGSIYNASKAALHSYSAALRVEVAPLGVKVITVITGGVKSRIARVERTLGKESAYGEIEDEYKKRQLHPQRIGMATEVYAKEVVGKVLAAGGWLWRTRTIWAGGNAGLARWLSWILPEAIGDWIISRMFGFSKMMK